MNYSDPVETTTYVWLPHEKTWVNKRVLWCPDLGAIVAVIPKGIQLYDNQWNKKKEAKTTYAAKPRTFSPGVHGSVPAFIQWSDDELVARFSEVTIKVGRHHIAKFILNNHVRVAYDEKKELLTS